MFDVDGLLVGYGGLAPEPLVELIAAGKARDYAAARKIHDRLLPVTKAVYHRGSHMEGTVALQDRPADPGHPAQRRDPLAAGRPDTRGRDRDRRRDQGRGPGLTRPARPTHERRLARPVTTPAGPGGPTSVHSAVGPRCFRTQACATLLHRGGRLVR
jgi:hypothetical protein